MHCARNSSRIRTTEAKENFSFSPGVSIVHGAGKVSEEKIYHQLFRDDICKHMAECSVCVFGDLKAKERFLRVCSEDSPARAQDFQLIQGVKQVLQRPPPKLRGIPGGLQIVKLLSGNGSRCLAYRSGRTGHRTEKGCFCGCRPEDRAPGPDKLQAADPGAAPGLLRCERAGRGASVSLVKSRKSKSGSFSPFSFSI